VDPRVPSSGLSCPSDGNENDDSEGEEDTQSGETRTCKGKCTKGGKVNGKRKATEKGKVKGKGKGHRKGISIVNQTPEGDEIACAISLLLQKEMYVADSDTEG
jgi:hypothetical protein